MSAEKEARIRIQEAALKEFAAYGLSGARMERIASAAKVNKAMIFYYFNSKENLHQVILSEVFSSVFPRMSALLTSQPGAEAFLEQAPPIYMDIFLKYPDFVKMIAMELLQNPKNVASYIQKLFEGKREGPGPWLLANMIRQWSERGEIAEPDPVQFMLNIVSLSLLAFLGKPFVEGMFQQPSTMADFTRKRTQSVINVLKRGMLT